MVKKNNWCRLCGAAYVPTKECNKDYCQDCSKSQNKSEASSKHTFTYQKSHITPKSYSTQG